MKKTTKAQTTKGFADLGVLFDGAEDNAEDGAVLPLDSSPRDTRVPQEDRALVKAEVISPKSYRLVGDLDHRPGEDAWSYLDRISVLLLKELVLMATAPTSVINARVKLDALKELIQRPMPARQVYDIRGPAAGSEFDRMTDAQVMEFVNKQIADMRSEPVQGELPSPAAKAESES